MKEHFYNRIKNSDTIDELNKVDNPNKGDISYVSEKGYDYRFNGKKWVKVRLVSHALAGWTLAATSLLACLAIALPLTVASISNFNNQSSSNSSSTTTKERMIGFVTNGGSAVDPIVKEPGQEVTAPAAPSKTAYRFDGWYIDSDLTTPYTFSTMPEENITLYAKWVVAKYTVHFDVNATDYPYDDVPEDIIDLYYGDPIDLYGKDLQTYQDNDGNWNGFDGWADKDGNQWYDGDEVHDDMTLYAMWVFVI